MSTALLASYLNGGSRRSLSLDLLMGTVNAGQVLSFGLKWKWEWKMYGFKRRTTAPFLTLAASASSALAYKKEGGRLWDGGQVQSTHQSSKDIPHNLTIKTW